MRPRVPGDGASRRSGKISPEAVLYDQIDEQRARPSNLYAADDDAKEVTERLIRDAGYDAVYVGGLDQARALEDQLGFMSAINQGGLGRFFYRYAAPGDL